MAPRLDLQALLVSMLGTANVYFQPPPTEKMQYPCIVYTRSDVDAKFADNRPYKHVIKYTVTIIDRNPDSIIHLKVGQLPMSSYDRSFVADGLNHDVYTLFF